MVLNLARCVLQALRTDMAQEFQFLVGVKKSGGSRGWNNELSEMRKTIGPGSHHLRPHRPPMHKL